MQFSNRVTLCLHKSILMKMVRGKHTRTETYTKHKKTLRTGM